MSRFVLCALFVGGAITAANAQAPSPIGFQGHLITDEGQPVDSANVGMTFKLFKDGFVIWTETQSVPVDSGGFGVRLGSVTPMDTVAFNREIELGITLVGEGVEMSPRTQLTSSAYARALPGFYTYYRDDGVRNGYNVIGGGPNNFISDGVVAATISGGGGFWPPDPTPNSVTGDYGTVGGGLDNVAARMATVSGGAENTASGGQSTIGGGAWHNATMPWATVCGGNSNDAIGQAATVAGGESNGATAFMSTVSGGGYNLATGNLSTIGGGMQNTASGHRSTIGGGWFNTADSLAAVGGGENNGALAIHSTVCGGHNNRVDSLGGAIGGGDQNEVIADYGVVGGGYSNEARGTYSSVGGGWNNRVMERFSTIGGGHNNWVTAEQATVAGGHDNHAHGYRSTIGGGLSNDAIGAYATIPGGSGNHTTRGYTFAAGQRARAHHSGAFVWADSSNADFASTDENQFLIRASGNVGIGLNNPGSPLTVNGIIESTTGGIKFPDGTVQTTAFPSPPGAYPVPAQVSQLGVTVDELYRLVAAQQKEIDALKELVDDLRRP